MQAKLIIAVNTAVAGHVSRDSAKALTLGLGVTRDVTLDFAGVGTVSPMFADEVFRTFALHRPGTRVHPINMAPAVASMVWKARLAAQEALQEAAA
jgi:STAS-like domain of unknown function (DUF4325)